jgi:hypothetical protein
MTQDQSVGNLTTSGNSLGHEKFIPRPSRSQKKGWEGKGQ